MEELINYLKIWYDNAIQNNDDLNAKSWGYEEGILITANEAKLIIDEWGAKSSHESIGLNKPDVIKSVCTCENSEKEKYSKIPVYCCECDAYVQTVL